MERDSSSTGWLKQLLSSSHTASDRSVIGAFDNDSLLGMIGLDRQQGDFTKHKARLWGLYVLAQRRCNGIGSALMTKTIEFVNTLNDVEKIELDVTAESHDAIRLYQQFGFRVVCTEANALKKGSRYIAVHRMEAHFYNLTLR